MLGALFSVGAEQSPVQGSLAERCSWVAELAAAGAAEGTLQRPPFGKAFGARASMLLIGKPKRMGHEHCLLSAISKQTSAPDL